MKECAAFIIPHFAKDFRDYYNLILTLGSILKQSDSEWICIIINDSSPFYNASIMTLDDIEKIDFRITVINLSENVGVGEARNIGVRLAAELGCKWVLFQDDDDLCHTDRLKLSRSIFENSLPNRDIFIYSSFEGIDRDGKRLPIEFIRADMLDVINQLDRSPVEGDNVLVDLFKVGFISTTSTVCVNTRLAIKCPFPKLRVSEDHFAWLHMAAVGAHFVYCKSTPTQYRFDHLFGEVIERDFRFISYKVHGDINGFKHALITAIDLHHIEARDIYNCIYLFLSRLADCITLQGYAEYAREIITCRLVDEIHKDIISQIKT